MRQHLKPISDLALDGEEKEMVLTFLTTARGCFERDGHCSAVLSNPATGALVALRMSNEEEKEESGMLIGAFSRQLPGPTMFITEAWATAPSRLPEDGKVLRPELDPERMEIVNVRVWTDHGKRTICILGLIERTTGQPPTLGPWQIMLDTKDGEFEFRKAEWRKEEE